MARILLGAACLVRPGALLGLVEAPDRGDATTRRIAQLLGMRLVTQGMLDLAVGPRLRSLDIGVDLTHAASMVPAAILWPAHRRSALVSAATATAIAALDIAGRGRS